MNCFRLEIIDDEIPIDGEFDKVLSTFRMWRSNWENFLLAAEQTGHLTKLNQQTEVICGNCGSFSAPSGLFLAIVQDLCEKKAGELIHDDLWEISQALVETKFDNEEEFIKYLQDGGPDRKLLHGPDGDWVYDEFTTFPIGLVYDDVAVIFRTQCACLGFFSKER
jgi:hypothetical protein